jgi:hypothetical protein
MKFWTRTLLSIVEKSLKIRKLGRMRDLTLT